jgi:SAM-dependent methyltransferase
MAGTLESINSWVKRSAAYREYRNSVPYVTVMRWLKAAVRKARLSKYLGQTFCCPICETRLRAFKPLTPRYEKLTREAGYYPLSRIETFNAAAYYCPSCDATDRERLYALYLERILASLDPRHGYRLIEFAPGSALHTMLARSPLIDYRSADLFRHSVDDRVDISDMRNYPDGSIDILLCSHILEHVDDDRKAMREIARVLRSDGFAIVMVPLVHGVDETNEDPTIITPQARWKHFGSDDHVRQYGKRDFVARLLAAGLSVEQLSAADFGDDAFRRAGIAPDSVLYVARKSAPASRGTAA